MWVVVSIDLQNTGIIMIVLVTVAVVILLQVVVEIVEIEYFHPIMPEKNSMSDCLASFHL